MIGLLDLGGTKLAASASVDGRLGPVLRIPTPQAGAGQSLIELLEGARNGTPLSAICVAAPGPFDREGRLLLNPPGMPEAWHGLNLGAVLGTHYRVPVILENDANCAALAEAAAGAGRGARTVVYFTVSTGIGTGVVRDGRLVMSRHDTEGGHQVLWPEWAGGPPCHCGGAGCLEALASGLAIERRFGVRGEALDDPAAWQDVGRWLGLAVTNATALLDPDTVVFGGGVCRSWARFAPELHRVLASHLRLQAAPRVLLGGLPEAERTLIGAGLLIPAGLT